MRQENLNWRGTLFPGGCAVPPPLAFRLGSVQPCSPATVTACHQQRVARVRAVSETKTCCLRASAANCFKKKPRGPGPDRITYDALIVVRTASDV